MPNDGGLTAPKSAALGNEMRGTGRGLALMIGKDAFLDFPIGTGGEFGVWDAAKHKGRR